MSKLTRIVIGSIGILGWAVGAWAAESKVETLTSDQTQAKYQRKSMTYIGIATASGVSIPTTNLQITEKAIRAGIELKRFDYNTVNLSNIFTIDQFVQELRAYVQKVAADRAGAEAEYSERFKRANVLFTDIERIMKSAYFYTISVIRYTSTPFTCPWDAKLALLQKCTPGQAGIKVQLDATATFYKANLMDTAAPPYSLLKEVKWLPADGFAPYESAPKPPEAGAARNIIEAYQQALAAYEQRVANMQQDASEKATAEAATSLSAFLSKEMKKIPEFQLVTPVTGVLPDLVEFMLGKEVGLGLDDTYDVTEFDAGGQKALLGYVKVREIGEAKGTGEGTPSNAEKIKEKRKFVGGELMFEHPMVGLALGVHFVAEMALKDMTKPTDNNPGMTMFPGIGIYADKNLANVLGVSELYGSLEGDILLLGSDDLLGTEVDTKLVHGMLGLKKKWYMQSLVATLGARAGVSYYLVSIEGGGEFEGDTLGFGGDVVAGLEYYVMPEFSVYLKAAGRFFTNPMGGEGSESPAEMGLNASVGAFVAF